MTPSQDTNSFAREAVVSAFAEDQQGIYAYGGMGWVVLNNAQLHFYDPYTNILTNLNPTNKPTGRDHAGLSYDSARRKLLMYGGQYVNDENTYVYDPATNAWTSYNLTPRPTSTSCGAYCDQYASVPVMAYDSIHDKHLLVAYLPDMTDAATDNSKSNNGSLETWLFDMGTMTWATAATTEPHGMNNMAGGCAKVRGRNMEFSAVDNKFVLESHFYTDCTNSGTAKNELWTYRYSNSGSNKERPKAPAVTTTATTVTASWTAVKGASRYQIYRATGTPPTLTFAKLGSTIATTSYLDSAVTPGTVYYYRYAPIYNGVEGKASWYARSQPKVMKAPTVSARADYDVDLAWPAHTATDIVGYNVYRGLATIHTNTTSCNQLNFTNGTSAFVNGENVIQGGTNIKARYVVKTSGEWAAGTAAGYISLATGSSGSYTAGAITGSISGAATASGASTRDQVVGRLCETIYDGYTQNVVQYVRNITGLTKLNGSPIVGTAYTDTTANLNVAGTESADYPFAVYAYVIKAVNNFGVESGNSPYALTIPSAPKNPLFNTTTKALKWDAASETGIVGYHVYKSDNSAPNTTAPVIRVTSSPVYSPYTIPNITYSTTQRFWIVPVDILGQEGIPSLDIWYGDFYTGFYSGSWHQ